MISGASRGAAAVLSPFQGCGFPCHSFQGLAPLAKHRRRFAATAAVPKLVLSARKRNIKTVASGYYSVDVEPHKHLCLRSDERPA